MKWSLRTLFIVVSLLPIAIYLIYARAERQRVCDNAKANGNDLFRSIPITNWRQANLEIYPAGNFTVVRVFNARDIDGLVSSARRFSRNLNQTIVIDVRCPISSRQLKKFLSLPSLQYLGLHDQDLTNFSCADLTTSCDKLQVVDLRGSKLCREFLEWTTSLDNLVVLNISDSNFEDSWFESCPLPGDAFVALVATRSNFGESGSQWCSRSSLKYLDIRGTTISLKAIQSLSVAKSLAILLTEKKFDQQASLAIANSSSLCEISALEFSTEIPLRPGLIVTKPRVGLSMSLHDENGDWKFYWRNPWHETGTVPINEE